MSDKAITEKVLKIIQKLAMKFDAIPVYDILDEAGFDGIPDTEAKKAIDNLMKEGEIFKPRYGFVRLVRQLNGGEAK